MFSILNVDDSSVRPSRPRPTTIRACDQCKQRKVRCDMNRPCLGCTSKSTACTYDAPRKKRGPVGKFDGSHNKIQRSLPMSSGGRDHASGRPEDTSPHIATIDLERAHGDTGGMYSEDTVQWSTPSSAQPLAHGDDFVLDSHFASSNFVAPYAQNDDVHPSTAPEIRNEVAHEEFQPSSSVYPFPSLPAESPADISDPFGAILEQELPPLVAADVWPTSVSEMTLLPWIDVYFKRLHPTIPVLNRTSLYSDMLLRKHRIDPQYGAMLLSLCAFAMTQPVQMHERASMPSRSVQARMLMEECVRMRVAADFGENPTFEMILASFFLFACLFGSDHHRAARHRLREAVDLAHSLGLHLPASYEGLGPEKRQQSLQIYLVLSVTERAYALQKNHAISFRGQPGITARFMQAFDPSLTDEYISSLLLQDQANTVGMTGLLYLMDTFDAIDESVMDCWNGYCKFSDGVCESFDRRRALQMFRAQRRVREACISGNISFAPSVCPLPLAQLVESQQADISITQLWTWNRLWNLCLSHQLLRERSEHAELQYDFACHIASALISYCSNISLAALEIHGVGMAEKIFDIAMGIVMAINTSNDLELNTHLNPLDSDVLPGTGRDLVNGTVEVQTLLHSSRQLLDNFRGGDHPYGAKFSTATTRFHDIPT